MRIGIDAHMLGHRETGNETYILELIQALAQVNKNEEFFLFVEDRELLPAHLRDCKNVFPIVLTTRSPLIRLLVELPSLCSRHRLDVLHVTYNAPLFCAERCALVVTVHDISYERYPEYFSRRDLFILRNLVPRSARRASKVITVSEFCKRELIEQYHLPPDKIAVTHEAASRRFSPVRDPSVLARIRDQYGTGDKFVLAVGNLQPRKNLVRLVEAFALARGAHHLPHKLVIVGQSQWKASAVFDAVQANHLEPDVILTGFVPDADLVLLYNAAQLFVYPSLYEGFGLPVLEAMACGTPVITSNTSALPEIAGGAACLVNPRDTDELARAITDVLLDPARQSQLRASGVERAAQFSWHHTAQETLRVYTDAVVMRKAESVAL